MLRIRPALTAVPFMVLGLAACDQLTSSSNGSSGDGDPSSSSNGVAYVPDTEAIASVNVDVPEEGVELGWGWNSFDAEPRRTVCVEFVPARKRVQTTQMNMKQVTDRYELMTKMGFSAAASVKTVGYKASGAAKFAKDSSVNSYSSSFLLNASIDNGPRYTAPAPLKGGAQGITATGIVEDGEIQSGASVRLTTEALALARKPNREQFSQRCGDAFVSAIFGGARLSSVITFKSTSKSDRESISTKMSGSGWGVTLEAEASKETDVNQSSENLDVSFFQTGGSGKSSGDDIEPQDEIPHTITAVLAKLGKLPEAAEQFPMDFRMTVTPYSSLSNWPGKPITAAQDEFEQLVSDWGAYSALYNEFELAMKTKTGFCAHGNDVVGNDSNVACGKDRFVGLNSDNLAKLKLAQDEVLHTLQLLERLAAECSEHGKSCRYQEGSVRSPYAYRIQLPVPKDYATKQDLVAVNIEAPAKRRCEIGNNNVGCLSNAQIAWWGDRLGQDYVMLESTGDLKSVVGKLPLGAGWYAIEADFPALWYPREQQAIVAKALQDAKVTPRK